MNLYSSNKNYKLYQGNMLDMLEVIDKESIDSIVTDPPYELNFMGKGWDNSGIAFKKETWQKCYEVLKPGGYLLAFGSSRTFHRIAVAIEDAGFEIRDTIMWLYGSGFPKSMNIGLAIDKKNGIDNRTGEIRTNGNKGGGINIFDDDNYVWKDEFEVREATNEWKGWGTALKPSFEPIIVARKPFKGILVDNVIEYGVGGINIDECRVETNDIRKGGSGVIGITGFSKGKQDIYTGGRYPANTILTYDETDFDEVCGGFPDTKSNASFPNHEKSNCNVNIINGGAYKSGLHYGDSGSASRYFYTAKASKKDRDEGLDTFNQKKVNDGRNTPIDNAFQRGETLRKNTHPTVKPTELMQYLVRLVSPNGATILDPFNGSGSTGKAVMYENKECNKNYKYIGIELTEEYLPISKARIEYVCNLKPEINPQISIFDLEDNNE